MTHWAASLIGKPYRSTMAGPDEFDCFGLVRFCVRLRYDEEWPSYQHSTFKELWAFVQATGWRKVAGVAQDGDVLLMDGLTGRHIGMAVQTSDGLGLLHAEGNDRLGSVRWQPLTLLSPYRNVEIWRRACTA